MYHLRTQTAHDNLQIYTFSNLHIQDIVSGIYIHIPFCKSRCAYRDFFSTTQLSRREAYVDALCKEAKRRLATLNSKRSTPNPITTIYFGGGTPSLLSPDQIARILQTIDAPQAIEVTIEANPGDLTPDYLRAVREAGVNRLSIGIQSFDDEVLRLIGRRHTAAEAKAAVKAAKDAGFNNISIDLIYGIPSLALYTPQNQSDGAAWRPHLLDISTLTPPLSAWEAQIEQALQLGVQHISTYCLSYEEGTRMTRMLEQGEITEVDEDTENAMYDLLVARLTAAGFEHYEVSNFSLRGYRSQHNSSYWNRTPYLGLGAGAHSYDGARTRSWNPDDLEAYIRAQENGEDATTCETLTDTDLYNERIMLGLRTAEGIAIEELHDTALATPYIERGLLRQTDNRFIATISGIHILNRIIEDWME